MDGENDDKGKQELEAAVRKLLLEAAGEVQVPAGQAGPALGPDGKPDPLHLPEADFQREIARLGEEGNGAEALRLMQARMAMMNQQTVAVGQQLLAENTEAVAKQQLGAELDRWLPKMEEVGKLHGFDPHRFTSVKQWRDALDLTKAKNIGEVIREEKERYAEELRKDGKLVAEEYAGGSVNPETPTVEAPAVGTPEFKAAKDLGMDPKEYAAQMRVLEQADNGYGQIQKVLLLDDDVEQMKKTGRIVVERGKF